MQFLCVNRLGSQVRESEKEEMDMGPERQRISEELKREKRKLSNAKKELAQAQKKQKEHEKLIKYLLGLHC